MRPYAAAAFAVVLIALGIATSTARAAAPALPCNPTTRMDTWWDEHGTQYECRCIRFPGETRPWCSWFKVPAEGRPAETRTKPRLLVVTHTPPASVPPVTGSTQTPGTKTDPLLAGDAWAQANL